jgi:glutamine cyclotransferase
MDRRIDGWTDLDGHERLPLEQCRGSAHWSLLRLSLVVVSLGFASSMANANESCPPTRHASFDLVRVFARSNLAFTEGLIFYRGSLIEGTGPDQEPAAINRIDVRTGTVTKLATAPRGAFQEGLTQLGEELVPISWKERTVFFWDPRSWRVRRKGVLPLKEGWGVATAGRQLIVSYGMNELSLVEPKPLKVTRRFKLVDPEGKSHSPNELEVVGDAVYANDFLTANILKIDIQSGCIAATIDLSSLYGQLTPEELEHVHGDKNYVLNGIAYDPAEQVFYLTGKRWPKVFVVRFR